MPKHTRGPWTCRPNPDKADPYHAFWIDGAPTTDGNGGAPVCEVRGVGDVTEANADLVAAAPDLLAALAGLVGGCGQEGDLFAPGAHAAARAAVDKATNA